MITARNTGEPGIPKTGLDTETRYRLLKLLEVNPDVSQRALAAELGISLGKTNYCLKALIDRGWVKMVNFTRSDDKTACFYKLTPSGIAERTRLAYHFLQRKRAEHNQLMQEIEQPSRSRNHRGKDGKGMTCLATRQQPSSKQPPAFSLALSACSSTPPVLSTGYQPDGVPTSIKPRPRKMISIQDKPKSPEPL